MMFDCDTTVTSYNKFQLLVGEWLFSLITFASISSVSGYSATHPLVFAMLIGLFVWLISMVLGIFMLMGKRDAINKKLELVYYGLFTFFTFVGFICAAANTLGAGPIKAAAAFQFFNIVLLGLSTWYSYKYVKINIHTNAHTEAKRVRRVTVLVSLFFFPSAAGTRFACAFTC